MILETTVLQSIECDNERMRQAVCEQDRCLEGFSDRIHPGKHESIKRSLFGEYTFHGSASAEDDGVTYEFESAKFVYESKADAMK